jgi:hypothetical protein
VICSAALFISGMVKEKGPWSNDWRYKHRLSS